MNFSTAGRAQREGIGREAVGRAHGKPKPLQQYI
jgi:hypothetical protein